MIVLAMRGILRPPCREIHIFSEKHFNAIPDFDSIQFDPIPIQFNLPLAIPPPRLLLFFLSPGFPLSSTINSEFNVI